ncbi:4Fe-4S dicluster domain-containing protein [Clostridium gasigenes]|uniref:[FeFe] hydrogenase, group B1/B3 n=1 Tax=Clostridium gasigenes TaxID=94869 RepID=A0A1H0SU42_9CLOT|nr:4Fe-4S dicluster domain-containing protein [Clostridium gasigenes]MBB6623429.1 4Fe-4S dicluster domain-containing protein [Clostridium gasigenes]MBU3089678.1 4Fe-4S dicluster domain-containing protein [Clostridium gasigenes]MBU3108511.1 4Fe-4S dicluster domain-containing protein [Clostridium gasigenes]MBU3137911.1 4Fe-4S dicluster domain-containing protein [Clostridium gasigenes]NKF07873.1 4Fe-4S binding protein [Clostridium gasigenes]
MIQFENQLKKLKHEVLTEVAKLAKEDKLTPLEIEKIPYEIIKGDKPQYRCCVYKERAIVLERSKLAAGYLANGDNVNDEFIDISPDDQIIYVIEAACDKCPINRYNVTDSCRNCLAHKCKETCNFGAISYINGRAYINQELCKECGMCKKACPYDAISDVMRPCKGSCPTGALEIDPEDRKAMIKEETCVNCGSCMSACPFGAISDKSLIVPVAKGLAKGKNLYAVVAPAITGQFGMKTTYGQIKNAIKKLGFKDMVEAACGADAVTIHESNEFIERMENGDKYMTNSCCPGFLTYVEKMFPGELNKVSGTVSPMVATGRYIKSQDPEAKVVFIGPCTAKKSEAVRESIKDAVDYVLTFEELQALFSAFEIEVAECTDEIVDDASIFGRGFGVHGGLTAAIENYVKGEKLEIDFKPVKVSGGAEIKKAMTMGKIGKLQGNFIEGMMCEGGCINGAGTLATAMKAKAPFTKINLGTTIKAVLDNKKIEEYKNINLERE